MTTIHAGELKRKIGIAMLDGLDPVAGVVVHQDMGQAEDDDASPVVGDDSVRQAAGHGPLRAFRRSLQSGVREGLLAARLYSRSRPRRRSDARTGAPVE